MTTIGVSPETRQKAKLLATQNNTSIKNLISSLVDRALAEVKS